MVKVPEPLGPLASNVEEVMRHLVLESVDKPRLGSPRQRPHSIIGKAGVVPRL
jgi:hypothetical protein